MYIYKLTNTINQKVYIGRTSRSNYKARFCEHKRIAFSPTSKLYEKHLYRAIRRYGVDNFTFEIIDTAKDLAELRKKEIYWIKFYESIDPKIGYNENLGDRPSWVDIDAATPNPDRKNRMTSGWQKWWSNLSDHEKAIIAKKNVESWRKTLQRNPKTGPSKRVRNKGNEKSSIIKKEKKSHRWKHETPEEARKRLILAAQASAEVCSKVYDVQYEDGEIFRIRNLEKFCMCNSLTTANMASVARGDQNHHKGWKCWNVDQHGNRILPDRKPYWTRKRSWRLCDPYGKHHTISNLKEFCRNNELSYGAIRKLANGEINVHKNWTFIE